MSEPSHYQIATPRWDTKLHCVCGEEFARLQDLVSHLRETLDDA